MKQRIASLILTILIAVIILFWLMTTFPDVDVKQLFPMK